MSVEQKKIKLELLRVQAARVEMELRVEEHYENIRRLEDNLKIQVAKEEELINKLGEANK
jgi:hypothetical protein